MNENKNISQYRAAIVISSVAVFSGCTGETENALAKAITGKGVYIDNISIEKVK